MYQMIFHKSDPKLGLSIHIALQPAHYTFLQLLEKLSKFLTFRKL
jgi:hypothetical protein